MMGWTGAELGQRLGISRSHVSHIESGRREVKGPLKAAFLAIEEKYLK